jgi:hypothetical protein
MYEGQWVLGLMAGKGKLSYSSGDLYEGSYQNN